MQCRECGEGKSKSETGLQSLGQGSWIRARNGEGQAGSYAEFRKWKLRFVEGRDMRWKFFRTSLGHGDVWIGVPVGVTRSVTKNILQAFGYPISGPSTLYIDNQSAFTMSKNPEHHG